MDRGLILHKSVNAKDFSAAKGCPLCKGKAAGSGRFVQNPSGGPYCGALSRKSGLQADGLRRRIFHESPSQYGPSNPYP
jgi:hypothetical protein